MPDFSQHTQGGVTCALHGSDIQQIKATMSALQQDIVDVKDDLNDHRQKQDTEHNDLVKQIAQLVASLNTLQVTLTTSVNVFTQTIKVVSAIIVFVAGAYWTYTTYRFEHPDFQVTHSLSQPYTHQEIQK